MANGSGDHIRLMKGNEALAEAALRAGIQAYFGYPITPQSEVLEYLTLHAPEHPETVVLQAESELAAINMVFGAAGAGARAMTSSSGPGISLMQEGLSYMACAQLPALVVNVQRGGPGLGPHRGTTSRRSRAGGTATTGSSSSRLRRSRRWSTTSSSVSSWQSGTGTPR
jgi:2-oxoglutarate ferredoxin oxidoreductase subunit alpha